MLPSLKIGRLFGVPVYLHSTLLLLPPLVLFMSSGVGLPTSLLLLAVSITGFGCVLLHEFGHVLMARRFGISTRDVTLYPIGGVARLERMTERPFEEILIALAGPAVNVVIAAMLTPLVFVFGLLLAGGGFTAPLGFVTFADSPLVWLGMFCLQLWLTNIVLVAFNLIPAFPMDGGRVFRAVLSHFFGLLRGTQIAVYVGIAIAFGGTAALILCGFFSPMLLIIAAFIALIGPLELRALRYREQQKLEAQQTQQYQAEYGESLPYTPLPYPDEDMDVPAAPAPVAPLQGGFSGYTWDREFGVWVKWQNGQRVAAYWNGPE